MGESRFHSFIVNFKDSDLWIGVDKASYNESMPGFAEQKLIEIRKSLEKYIVLFPSFQTSLVPVNLTAEAPEIAVIMNDAGKKAGTGPMSAVAGAIAEAIGISLRSAFDIQEIVIENGGDIYLSVKKDIVLSIYAGNSPLSEKIGLKVSHVQTPLGVCTSAGTVGPSLSFGKANAVLVSCKNTALADAYATHLGNRVRNATDVQKTIDLAGKYNEILSAIIICNSQVGITGQFEICPIN
jgi:uncharacterized protein